MSKLKQALGIAAIITVWVISCVCLVTFVDISNNDIIEDTIIKYTDHYTTVNVTEAKIIINDTVNLTVVDCRGGCKPCTWKKGKLPNAIWETDPTVYVNSTNDILVYCLTGVKSLSFCEQLVNNTYGKIYSLDGGYNSWRSS